MAETLGMLLDKLTVVKLKQYHTGDSEKLDSLTKQSLLLQEEIDEYVNNAVNGVIPLERLTFESNKVVKNLTFFSSIGKQNFGEIFFRLAEVNCELWHEQEKVYEFENVPLNEKDKVVKQLAVLNLERNQCIDAINNKFAGLISKKKTTK